MSFKEKNFQAPTRHNPYLHKIVVDFLAENPRGRVLDIPSGPGYLLQDLQKQGFTGVASEIDTSLHCLDGIDYKAIDMTAKFPFKDAEFDYLVSIEGIEHIENHVAFLREARRVLKSNGLFILTTPNIMSLQSRWRFFLSGFHDMASKPIPLDTENIYFEHINPISLPQLYFFCEKFGLQIESVKTYRYRTGSKLLLAMFYPFVRWATYAACFVREKSAKRREQNKALYRFLRSKECLLGTHLVVTARAK